MEHGAVPSLLGTDPLSSALLSLRTATAKAMSTLPLPALSPSDWGCRADTGLSGPGAPCGMSPWPCFEWPNLGVPPFLSPIWGAQSNCLVRGYFTEGDEPRIVPRPLSPKHNLNYCKSHGFSKSDARRP